MPEHLFSTEQMSDILDSKQFYIAEDEQKVRDRAHEMKESMFIALLRSWDLIQYRVGYARNQGIKENRDSPAQIVWAVIAIDSSNTDHTMGQLTKDQTTKLEGNVAQTY